MVVPMRRVRSARAVIIDDQGPRDAIMPIIGGMFIENTTSITLGGAANPSLV
jgi:hypothetical protein